MCNNLKELGKNQVPQETVDLADHLMCGAVRFGDIERAKMAMRILNEDSGIIVGMGIRQDVEVRDIEVTERSIVLKVWDGGYR